MSHVPHYNFARGHPNSALVPAKEMRELLLQIATSNEPDGLESLAASLNYGDEAGQPSLVHQLRLFLQRQCLLDQGPHMDSNSLFITGGVSHGLELLCAVATRPGDSVWLEDPTYFLAANIFTSHGLHIDLLPMRRAGVLDVDRLEERLVSSDQPGYPSRPRVMYIIPTHHNPTGQTMPLEDRMRLAALANRYGILLIADEVYHLLDIRGTHTLKRPARMAMFNDLVDTPSERKEPLADSEALQLSGCCSVSSFTKIFGPGVRLGWIEGPPSVTAALRNYGYIVSQGGVAPFMGHVLSLALQTRVCDRVLSHLCQAYSHRIQLLVGILSEDSRLEIPYIPNGGYFLWLRLPFDAAGFLKYCQPNLTFLLGTQCRAILGQANNEDSNDRAAVALQKSIRLCFAYLDLNDLEAGARLFLAKFRSYADSRE